MPEERDAQAYDGILDHYAPADKAPDQGEELEKLSKRLDEAFDDSYDVRLPYERDWELYRLYLKGEQGVLRNSSTGEIARVVPEDTKQLRSVNNVLRPTARSLIGKMSRTIPTCVTVPATADFDEIHGAQAATALLEYARRKEDLDCKFVEAIEYMPWTGNAIIQLAWDRDGGKTLAWCQTCGFNDPDKELIGQPCPQCSMQREGEQQQQQMEMQEAQTVAMQQVQGEGLQVDPNDMPEVQPPDMQQMGPLELGQEPPTLVETKEGDFTVRVRDVRNFYPEPGATSIQAASWVGLRVPMPVHEVRRMFPLHQHHIRAEDNILADRTAELRSNSIEGFGEVEYLNDHAYLYEFHERPSEMYPQGRLIFRVNDMIVEILDGQDGRADNPYHVLGRFSFYHFKFDRNMGEFWGEPFLAQAWHRQREINQLETQIREHIALQIKPTTFIPIGSRISQDELTSRTGQLVKWNAAAGKPFILDRGPLSQQVFARRDELIGDVRVQASVTEQEAGVSQSDPNGRAMAIIEAEADQQLGAIMVHIHSEWRDLHRGILQIFRAYAHQDRLWTTMGPDGLRTYSFDELELAPGHDVQI